MSPSLNEPHSRPLLFLKLLIEKISAAFRRDEILQHMNKNLSSLPKISPVTERRVGAAPKVKCCCLNSVYISAPVGIKKYQDLNLVDGRCWLVLSGCCQQPSPPPFEFQTFEYCPHCSCLWFEHANLSHCCTVKFILYWVCGRSSPASGKEPQAGSATV